MNPLRVLGAVSGIIFLVAACLGGTSITITGEIRDDAISLSADHAGPNIQLALRNVGTSACDIEVVSTSLPADALPVKDGRVVVDASGVGPVRPTMGGPAGSLAQVAPGAEFNFEVALEGTPKTDDRVILCNGVGDYADRRYAVLRFDR